jgi:hypothetical protein
MQLSSTAVGFRDRDASKEKADAFQRPLSIGLGSTYTMIVLPMAGSVVLSSPVSTWPEMRRWKLVSELTSMVKSYQPWN